MIKILIAEDELPLLRGLKILIEQISDNYKVVKSAKNGKEAIEYLKENSVDLVLTDINMPLIDGLELMKYIHDHNIEVKKVVISGYDKFSYAKQALQYGAEDYILKPIIKTDLENLLEEITKEIETDRKEGRRDSLYANINEGKINKVGNDYLVIHIGYENILYQHQNSRIKKVMNTVEDFVEKKSGFVGDVFAFQHPHPQEQIILVSNIRVNASEVVQSIKVLLETINMHHTIVYSSKLISSENLFEFTSNSSIVLKKHALFERNLIMNIDTEDPILLELDSQSYPYTLEANYNLLMKRFESLINQTITQLNTKVILSELLIYFEQEDKQFKNNLEGTVERIILDNPLKSDFLNAIYNEDIFKRRLIDIKSTEDMMMELEDYVLENLHESLTVSFLAERFGFVPPYLSALFKEYHGNTLYQFIQNERIEKAKELITQEYILIKDVSKMVGYQDPLHFSKVFKSKVGKSPREYQQFLAKKERR